jgi:hypothetical protein
MTDRCACVSPDAYECHAHRYGIDEQDLAAIEMDGGPCECKCHQSEEDDDE